MTCQILSLGVVSISLRVNLGGHEQKAWKVAQSDTRPFIFNYV